MCLHTLQERFWEREDEKSGFGYKVFRIDKNGNIRSQFKGRQIYKLGQWHQSSNGKLYASLGYHSEYPAGFHILTNRRAISQWMTSKDFERRLEYKAFKVEYRGCHSKGEQCDWNVVVAREMRIIEAL